MRSRILILGLVLLVAANAAADDPWTVVLDGGDTHEGTLLRLQPGRYLLQTDTALYELSDDDIDARTFADRPRSDAIPRRRIIEAQRYEEIRADGTSRMLSSRTLRNTSGKAITEIGFGLAPWEREFVDQKVMLDGFGNLLVPTYDPPRDKWADHPDRRVQLDLALPIPVAPGESGTLVTSQTITYSVHRTDDGFAYVHHGDYAEDRLVWLKVRLPFGADIDRIEPQASARFTHEGFEYVMWRRYYKKGESTPLRVYYRLP